MIKIVAGCDAVRDAVFPVFTAYAEGFYTSQELKARLDELQVRGTWSGDKWCGYDYRHQSWLTVEVQS